MTDFKDFRNMWKALKKSCNNVRWKTSVTRYELNGLKNTAKLIQNLQTQQYRISKYYYFTIFEPKKREIVATKIKDRQVQRAICTYELYKDLTKSFIYDNCACQIGKGTHFAIHRLKRHLQRFYRKEDYNKAYYLKCDIHHFFESIRHDVLIDIIKKKVKNLELQQLTIDVINSFKGDKGIGLGSQISQLLALSVLDNMDHIIKEKLHIHYYIRYMDDFILIHQDKKYLQYCLFVIKEHLNSLGLELNSKTTILPLKDGINFLNWHYVITNTGKILMLQLKKRHNRRKRKIKNIIKKIGPSKLVEINQSMNGIIAYLKNGNTYKIQQEIKEILNKY